MHSEHRDIKGTERKVFVNCGKKFIPCAVMQYFIEEKVCSERYINILFSKVRWKFFRILKLFNVRKCVGNGSGLLPCVCSFVQ